MIPRPAQYLLRFDDLCPTVSRVGWERFVPVIQEFGVRPILAVVPDNQDHALELSPPDPDFWALMRKMEAAGATIALHGYQHLCASEGRGLLPLHRQTEFAGVPEQTQRQWIQAGLAILRGHGLDPRIWVAPRHGFDGGTLRALAKEGIHAVSDGFARVPFTRGGVTWIPQQLWAPVEKTKGLWTICVHSNTAHNSLVDELRAFLCKYAAQFTSVERVLAEFEPAELSPVERLYERFALWRIRASRIRKRPPFLRQPSGSKSTG
jgi:predicted deacetylase